MHPGWSRRAGGSAGLRFAYFPVQRTACASDPSGAPLRIIHPHRQIQTERQMVNRYDPDRAPDPRLWRAADESELMELVARWHAVARIRMPNPGAHAALHVMVENQAAMLAETPVAEAIKRLMGEGLSRHEALHAIGSVLLTHMN